MQIWLPKPSQQGIGVKIKSDRFKKNRAPRMYLWKLLTREQYYANL